MKAPVPFPFSVLRSAVVGFAVVDQHTPLAVISPPPSAVISPPEVAVVEAISVTAAVVSVAATTSSVVNDTSLP